MKIDDYEKADCSLFRTPPMDFSEVGDTIEQSLVNAWRRGYSANSAINSVLEDQDLVDKLASQVSENLGFQRAMQKKRLDEQKEAQLRSHEQAYRERVERIGSTLGKDTEGKKAVYDEENEEFMQHYQIYNAAAARLAELRARVKEDLDYLGGEEGVATLLTIRNEMDPEKSKGDLEAKAEGKEKRKRSERKERSDEEITDLHELHKPKVKPGYASRIFSTIKRILNYKIW